MYSSPASIFTVNALLPPGVPDLFIAVFQDELMDTPGPYRHLPSVWGGENINETDKGLGTSSKYLHSELLLSLISAH